MEKIIKLLFLIVLIEHSAQRTIESDSTSGTTPRDAMAIQKMFRHYKHQPKLGGNIVSDITITNDDEDLDLSIVEMGEKCGWPVDEYEVTTEDGYNLSMHRIQGVGPAVFLMHGLLGSSDDWLTAGRGNGLAYILASNGYDVWIGNSRGNKYSNKHESLSTDDEEYWDFSLNEIGRFDVPAMIDFILQNSSHKNITYIGVSQGTTAAFIMCSSYEKYNSLLNMIVALAPVAWMSHTRSPVLQVIAANYEYKNALTRGLGVGQVNPDEAATRAVANVLCGDDSVSYIVCENIGFLIAGFNKAQLNSTSLRNVLQHYPAGGSMKQLIHIGQLIESGFFRDFDYGAKRNIEVYNSIIPEDYDVNKITVKTALFYGDNDLVANTTDVKYLKTKLNNVVAFNLIEGYGHLDFLWGLNVKELVYDKVVMLLNGSL